MDGNRKWNIYLRCFVRSTSRLETENRKFFTCVLLDLQARWKQKREYFPPVFCWMYKSDGNRKWNIFLRCSVGSTSRMETEKGIFSSSVLLDLQAGRKQKMEYFPPVFCCIYNGRKQKMEYFPPVFCWMYKSDGNRKWNIFLHGVLLDHSRLESVNGIFSSGVILDLQARWKQKIEYFPLMFCWIYKPDGNRKWNIFLRCSVGSTSRVETENGIFSFGVLLDLQVGWKQKIEYFSPVFCWIYKPDKNRRWNIFLQCSVGSTSRMETVNGIFSSGVLFYVQVGWKKKTEYFPPVFCWIYKPDGNRKMEYFPSVFCWIYKPDGN